MNAKSESVEEMERRERENGYKVEEDLDYEGGKAEESSPFLHEKSNGHIGEELELMEKGFSSSKSTLFAISLSMAAFMFGTISHILNLHPGYNLGIFNPCTYNIAEAFGWDEETRSNSLHFKIIFKKYSMSQFAKLVFSLVVSLEAFQEESL
jgi:hypothetical protein